MNTKVKKIIAQGTYSDMVSVRKSDILHIKEGQRLEVPGGYIEVITVTPEFAKELLGHKHDNQRHVRHRHVEALADAMSKGRWRYTMDPIRLNDELQVIDGQHRLLAVVKSGKAQKFIVAILEDPEAFYALDQGVSRSLNDIRATQGKKTIGRVIIGAILLEGRDFATRSHSNLSKEEVDRTLDSFPYMEEVMMLDRLGRRAKIHGVGSLAAAIAAMRVNKTEAIKFFSAVFQMTSFIDDHESHQAHVLYMFLHSSREKGGQRTTGEYYILESAYKSIRAWNAWRRGEAISKLQYEPGGKFPKVYR